MRTITGLLVLLSLFHPRASSAAERGVVVFFEEGFPTADSAPPRREELERLVPGARWAVEKELARALKRARLLVLPYGSAFPEAAWPALRAFLDRGGNLLAVGGKPFTRAAYRDESGWHLRPESVRFIRALGIDQYQRTPPSEGLEFHADPVAGLEPFVWKQAWSPLVHLAGKDLYRRDGSAGSIDARLDALAWGSKDGRRLAAPILRVDHLHEPFAGGRWILVPAELTGALSSLAALVEAALRGSEEFTVAPRAPLYVAGEDVELDVHWRGAGQKLTARLSVAGEGASREITVAVPARRPVKLRAAGKGLQLIEARLFADGKLRAVHRSGFWIRDREYLRSGPRLGVNQSYFELDGKPMAVVGTTAMASDVQRLFFEYPNAAVWDADYAELAGAGMNMVRTGWWTAWDKLADGQGRPHERTLRALEAYLMTARKHGLPLQVTFFAFLPDVFGGGSAYFDPQAIARQRTFIRTIAEQFHDVPFVAWDLINEPSFGQQLWSDRPSGDRFERARWNEWLRARYPDRAALAHAWNLPAITTEKDMPLPSSGAFEPRGVYGGQNSLALHDYFLFVHQSFTDWARGLRETIRATGSRQLVTVGQDEGGFLGRPSPPFFAEAVDFTTNHSWWENDALLWDSLVAKQPGQAMLIQETGFQRELNLDETARRDPDGEAALVERKMAMSFVQGGGVLQWLWHTNSYMTQANEVSIGAVRADRTEKPEAAVVRAFARFAQALGPYLRDPERPPVAIVTSQVAQFSTLRDLQIEAQQAAVRALISDNHQPAELVAENQLAKLGTPKLVILPSPQALGAPAWRALLDHVSAGGSLLVTGPVERDEHWHRVARVEPLLAGAALEPLTYRAATLALPGRSVSLSFGKRAQTALEALRFSDGSSLGEVSHGKGRIFWAAQPVELAEGREGAAALYAHVLARLGLQPPAQFLAGAPAGVLVYPTVLREAVLYVIVSERADDVEVRLKDRLTGGTLNVRLPSRRAALAVLRRADGALVARYGF